jgi:hypothetical protein
MDKNNDNLITSSNLYKNISQHFISLAITSTLFAPVERMKLVLQTMKLMSINDHEKVYKLSHLSRSK